MKIVRIIICLIGLSLVAACSEEPPPTSVSEFMESPRLLEATMVRCAQNRTETKYMPECVNARDAVNRLERVEERSRRESLELQSERKRQALRRTQEAAASARRRADEEQRRRAEAEYLGIFEELPADSNGSGVVQPAPMDSAPSPASNAPGADVPPAAESDQAELVEFEEAAAEPGSDLEAVREELKRRQQPPE
jgi:hypothetical protein